LAESHLPRPPHSYIPFFTIPFQILLQHSLLFPKLSRFPLFQLKICVLSHRPYIRATNTVHLKFFDSLTLIFNSLITLTSSNFLIIPPFTCKIRLITLFSNTYILYSTRSRQAVWHPCRTASRPTVVLISSHPDSSDIFQY